MNDEDALVMLEKLSAELDKCAAALPGSLYMDPPDGGDVPVSEQLRRMAQDAARYRYLERKAAISFGQFKFNDLPRPVDAYTPIPAEELRDAIDMELGVKERINTGPPIGWSNTDWTKHMEEQQHPLAGLHINRGSMDAAADAYEAEYNAAHEARRVEAKRVR
jgi:hypothetical protein